MRPLAVVRMTYPRGTPSWHHGRRRTRRTMAGALPWQGPVGERQLVVLKYEAPVPLHGVRANNLVQIARTRYIESFTRMRCHAHLRAFVEGTCPRSPWHRPGPAFRPPGPGRSSAECGRVRLCRSRKTARHRPGPPIVRNRPALPGFVKRASRESCIARRLYLQLINTRTHLNHPSVYPRDIEQGRLFRRYLLRSSATIAR